MIKKILLGIGISIVSFLGFSNAGLQTIGLSSSPSAYDQNYSLTFLKGGGLLSSFLGLGKSFLALNGDSFLWWSVNGQPYFYNPHFQGYFGEYWSCDEITGSDSVMSNCSSISLTGNYTDIFKGFFNNVVAGDYAYYDYVYEDVSSSHGFSRQNGIHVCWSSHSIGKSLCFRYYRCSNSYGCAQYNHGSLVNSLNLSNLEYNTVPYSLIGYAPGQAGYDGTSNIDGGSSVSDNTTLSGNLLYNTCTNGFIISDLERYWKKSDCYAGIVPSLPEGSVVTSGMDFNVLGYMPGTGKTIMEVFTQTKGGNLTQYGDWINTRGYLMYKYKSTDMENPFIGAPVELNTLFNNLYNRGFVYPEGVLDPYILLNYCKLKLNSNESNINDPYTGTFFKSRCDKIDFNVSTPISSVTTGEVGDVDGDDEVLPPGTDIGGGDGSVTSSGMAISVNWSGTLSGDTNKNFEGKTFINDFYQKLQSKFSKPVNNVVGIVPSYILVFMFALILFRFLSH